MQFPFSGDFSIGATVFTHNLHLLSLLSLSIDTKNDAPWKTVSPASNIAASLRVSIRQISPGVYISLCGSMSHFVMEIFKVYWDALSAANTRQRLILECHDDLQTFCGTRHNVQGTPQGIWFCAIEYSKPWFVYNIQKSKYTHFLVALQTLFNAVLN